MRNRWLKRTNTKKTINKNGFAKSANPFLSTNTSYKNQKSERITIDDNVRIIWLWWERMDSNHRSRSSRFTVCPLWPLGNSPKSNDGYYTIKSSACQGLNSTFPIFRGFFAFQHGAAEATSKNSAHWYLRRWRYLSASAPNAPPQRQKPARPVYTGRGQAWQSPPTAFLRNKLLKNIGAEHPPCSLQFLRRAERPAHRQRP